MRLIQISLAFLMAGILSAASPGRFAGHWVASFKGTDICMLEIEEDTGQVTGVSKVCRISVDQNGDLIEAEAPDGSETPQPFLKPKIDGAVLSYELEEDDGERMKFEFRLTGDGKAELRFIGAPIAIKPVQFGRR